MKFNPRLKTDLEKYRDYVFIVEGKKDVNALNSLGIEKVYAIHQTGISLKERVEELFEIIGKKEKVCILTDFDKKGKQLYMLLKREMGEIGFRLDSSFRGLLIKARMEHIEELKDFFTRVGKIG